MTGNWVSQVESSLGCIYIKNIYINIISHRILSVNCCYNSNNLCEYCWFSLCDFCSQTVLILPYQNVLVSLDQKFTIIGMIHLILELFRFWVKLNSLVKIGLKLKLKCSFKLFEVLALSLNRLLYWY